jgi:hypothetical protein
MSGPVKRAEARMTLTPRPVKRSSESLGAMASITSCTCRCTAAKSACGAPVTTPNRPALRAASAACAAARSAFDGTQPKLRQSPPISVRSINTVLAPNCDAPAATVRPPEPAPMTQMSTDKISLMAFPFAP